MTKIVVFEASPIAYGYANELADTGITRVCKNLVRRLDGLLTQAGIRLMLFSQEGAWENFLLNKYVHDESLSSVQAYVDGQILPFSNARHLSLPLDELGFVKQQLQGAGQEHAHALWRFLGLYPDATKIYHAHYLPVPAGVRALPGTAVLHTVHDLFPLTHPNLFTKDMKGLFSAKLAQLMPSDHFACVSSYTQASLLEQLSFIEPGQMKVILNAANHFAAGDSSEVGEVLRLRELGLESGRYFSCVSTIEPRKNLVSLIRGYRRYTEQCAGPAAQLALCGAVGWLPGDEFQGLQAALAHEKIKLLGRLSDADLRIVHKHARAYVSGSVCEGFGLGALEAMSMGVPAIVPDNTAQGEVARGYGDTLNEWTEDRIADALARMDDATARRTASERCQRVVDVYSWERAATEYLAFYEEIFSGLEVGSQPRMAIG